MCKTTIKRFLGNKLSAMFSSGIKLSMCLIMMNLSSCNQGQVVQQKQYDSLLSVEMKDYGKYLQAEHELKIARDSIRILTQATGGSQHLSGKIYAFVGMEYTRTFYSEPKKYNCVSNVIMFNDLDEEEKYRWMDEFSNSFLHENNILTDYSIDKRKVYTFDNYIDASKKREEVYKYGIRDNQ